MQLAYKKFGSGKPVIILHGLYGSSNNWFSVCKTLALQYEVFAVDMRNHGKSHHAAAHNYESMQQDVFDFMTLHNISKASIIGHSMGGKTAMLFALLHPEMVDKLIIVDIAPKSYKSLLGFNSQIIEHLNIINAYSSVDISEMTSRSEIELAFSEYVKSPHLRQFLLKNAVRNENGQFHWAINVSALQKAMPVIMDWPAIEKLNLTQNEIVTLFIRGEKSDYILDEDWQGIKKIFPKAEQAVIFDAGHWVHAEQPDLFLNAVNGFLSREN